MHQHLLRGLMILILTLLSGVGTLSLSAKASYADVAIKYDNNFVIDIFNTISKADATSISQRAAEFEYASGVYVKLNSPGGDVDAAMQIGRVIRKTEGHTSVVSSAKCYHSCVLIYIAGVARNNLGAIGFPSPTIASAPQTIDQALASEKIKAYVQEMGVTDDFYQAMTNTEASKVYMGGEVSELVPDIDPKHDEAAIFYRARAYGIDKAEMRRRSKEGEQCARRYNDIRQVFVCLEASYWGLTPLVYSKREMVKRAQCKLSDAEEQKLKMVKRREVVKHPLYLKREACVRRVMLGK